MAASQLHITNHTPMGANLVSDGATFRVWAPNALKVYVVFDFSGDPNAEPTDPGLLLVKQSEGHWTGFFEGLAKGKLYMLFVVGAAGGSLKRDPQARALTPDNDPLNWRSILEGPDFPWHDQQFITPKFSDMVIYQLHIGSYYTPRLPVGGTFLDVAAKVPYLAALGITVIQLLPIHEWEAYTSMGYNGIDFYSPEQLYTVQDDDPNLQDYLTSLNTMLANKGQAAYLMSDIKGGPAQLRSLIDLCHVYGVAVVFDLVFSNAWGWDAYDMSYFDMQENEPPFVNSPFLTPKVFNGQVFRYEENEVCNFLINNAKMFLEEYHVDGFRFDEISMTLTEGGLQAWQFIQNLTPTLKYIKPDALLHAEYWQGESWGSKSLVVVPPPTGAGFDTVLSDSQYYGIRGAITAASQVNDNPIDMLALGKGLQEAGYPQEWQLVQGPENQDKTYYMHPDAIRITQLSDPSNPRSWYATSRSRVAMGICLTGPGIPMMFMGQEFLENKTWADDLTQPNHQVDWDGLDTQKQMADFLRFTSDLIALRWKYPALRGQGFAVTHTNDAGRVLVYQRWIPDQGQDVIIVIHLGNSNVLNYRIGFPHPGFWKETFNSDIYENWVNPDICGNYGGVTVDKMPYDGFNHSAELNLPANGVLVFAQ